MEQFLEKHLWKGTVLLSVVVVITATTLGVADISFLDTMKILLDRVPMLDLDLEGIRNSSQTIVWSIRFPRVLLALLVGGTLAICGASYQGMFKNPMADPYILGVSSGAALGATIGIVFRFSFQFLGLNSIALMAFAGAILSLFLVYNISRVGNKVPVNTLLLSGIAIGQFLSAIVSLLMIFSDEINRVVFWTMGSFNAKSWSQLFIVFPYMAIGVVILYAQHRELDIMLLGEDTAAQLGVDTERLKKKVLLVTAIITGAAVSVTGIIGFVGLIVPHVVRILTGPKHKRLIPYSFVVGGLFMIICDTLARTLTSQEIPVGIITSLFGGPFFIYLLKKRKKSGV
ncbi:iron ABC transporter permease [Alkalibacter rhizosphaerae]|uniref:Iron ABC transporter permease n=1 Tax=Alkalibacter rhizosphaerae TaxID=2815577 RepID=A0A974XGU1_9FIRM|nr:iron chelate uptake ABC transporter family permease subunit [Alkalibacter rhizosphaerae]QSX08375.1 iron ABC transporter permease [Alkalibacter rhizosphaerae]